MAAVKVCVSLVKGQIMLRFDARVPGRVTITPRRARQLAVRLHLCADKVDPRTWGNGSAPHRRKD